MASNNVLVLPDFSKEFVLETDASNYGVGAVLSQMHEEGLRPIAYWSKHLSIAQRNYSASERELLAVLLAMEHFRQCLYGRLFRVITDHQPLKSLMTAANPHPQLARWFDRISKFEFKIEYRRGRAHGNADAFSRLLDDQVTDEPESDMPDIVTSSTPSNSNVHLKTMIKNRTRTLKS